MRLFIYEECEKTIERFSKEVGLTPTKYINELLKILEKECHTDLTEDLNERIKNAIGSRNRFNKS